MKSNACANLETNGDYLYVDYFQAIAQVFLLSQNPQEGFFCQDFLQGVKNYCGGAAHGSGKGRGCRQSR
jgi:hypothetical protein